MTAATHTCGVLAIPCEACKPAPAPPAALSEAQLSAMEDEARKKIPEKVAPGWFWEGPCGDSFCFASCDAPHCRYENRLGKTPDKHNQKIDELIATDPVLILVAQLRRKL